MISIVNHAFHDVERIDFHEFEKDFLFIVNGEIYQTNSFVANILSPNISKNYKEKVKTSYYEINTKHEGDFNKIIEYGEMKSINISKEERKYFIDILKQLGNRQECAQFYEELQEDISYENVINRILIKQELDIQFEEEISFISNNFDSFYTKYPESILTLDVNIIERIISNDEMKLNNEEELFDLILELYDKSKEYSILFSYVNFNNLSIESIKKFTNNFDINDINSHIWKNIRQRLEQDISHQKSLQIFSTQTIEKKTPIPIFKYLSEKFGGNVFKITASSIYSGPVEYIVEEDDDKLFGTENKPDSWIKFDFKERKVLLDRYTLKTFNCSECWNHLKNWVLEVSDDDNNFTEIDRHENCDLLNGKLKTATFEVSHSTPARFVRLRQTGLNWGGYNNLVLNQIEFSGFICE